MQAGRYWEALDGQMRAYQWHQAQRLYPISKASDRVWRAIGNDTHEAILRRTLVSTPYFWSGELCGLLEASADTLPDWTFLSQDSPTQDGFIWFERPLPVPGPYMCRALGWSWLTLRDRKTNKTVTQLYPDQFKTDTAILLYSWLVLDGQLANGTTAFFFEGANLNVSLESEHHEHEDIPDASGVTREGTARILRYFAAATAFMTQRITTAEGHRAPRETRRRAEKMQWEGGEEIQVVTLRRKHQTHAQAEPSEPVDWSCRWWVGPFWRQQWYPSLGIHQPVFIMPYLKGPDDKPIKPPNQKVFAVVR